MQLNKKLLSIAVTALLVLSVVAAAAPAFAAPTITTVSIYNPLTGALTPLTAPYSTTVGTILQIDGTGANVYSPIIAYWDSAVTSKILNNTQAADGTGVFSVQVKVPSSIGAMAAGGAGDHAIIIRDDQSATGAITVTVTPKITASVSPSTGTTVRALPGDTVTITGNGFAASSSVTLTYASTTLGTPVTGTFPVTVTTNSTGSFTASVTVPAIAVANYDTYTITATDSATAPNSATVNIIINYYVRTSPATGPAGITTTISGRIPVNTAYTITLSGNGVASTTITSGTSDSLGSYSYSYQVPSILAANINPYTITVTWGVTNFVTTSFTVTTAPTATLSAASGAPGASITVTGTNFVASANVTLYFGTVVVNSTALDSRFGPTTTSGGLSAVFAVPNLVAGSYVVTVVDQYGASATVTGGFTVNPSPVTVVSTASSYAQGDTISFSIVTTDSVVTSVGVAIYYVPTGVYWWGTPTAMLSWPVTAINSTHYTVLFPNQVVTTVNGGTTNIQHLTLPANAPTGSWNWTVTYTPVSGVQTSTTGIFTVMAGGVTGINTQLSDMNTILMQINGTVATLKTSSGSNVTVDLSELNAKLNTISGNIATLQTSMGTVTTSVNSLSGSISSISSNVATVKTDLGTIQTSLSSLDAVLGAVAGDTATLKTSLGDVTTSLSSIGTTVTSINGNVATVKTDLGTLSGTVTSISGNVATIQTSIGSMQADISNMQSDVSSSKSATDSLTPLIIVAIVLALVAAIAAIASIVLMRRKIAG